MGMFSEIATEETIRSIIKHIDAELVKYPQNSDAAFALKAVARLALTEFDWDTPQWAKDARERFKP